VIALPPSLAGAVQPTVADVVSATAVAPVGASGTVDETGVTAFDAADCGPEPLTLDAVTRNVYVVPLVRPPTVAVVAGGEPLTVVDACAVDPMAPTT
jgi:hypothetical protein